MRIRRSAETGGGAPGLLPPTSYGPFSAGGQGHHLPMNTPLRLITYSNSITHFSRPTAIA